MLLIQLEVHLLDLLLQEAQVGSAPVVGEIELEVVLPLLVLHQALLPV